jgi:signal transduction histidine kinase
MNNERVALAQELHDGIAQDLVALGFSIDSVISGQVDASIKNELRAIRFTVTDLIDKVRKEIHELRVADYPTTLATTPSINREVLMIVQEILRNTLEHSGATSFEIDFKDDGIGGVKEEVSSFGLRGIHERIEKLNGEIRIESNHNGTRISLRIPIGD